MDYFRRLTELLKLERAADEQSYKRIIERASVHEKRASGLAWYPIGIRGTELGRGDYLTVELERTTNQDVLHQFRFGMPAAIFSNHNAREDRIEGTISYQGGNTIKLTVKTDELPDWSRNGKLGIELLFDDNSYDEMFAALRQADLLAEKDKDARLIKVLLGIEKPDVIADPGLVDMGTLNNVQQTAVQQILTARDLAIVHGPPGTGKTTTLVQAIKHLCKSNKETVLVTAPSNAAVDLLSEKLAQAGLNVTRIGNPVRVSERLNNLTLDSKISSHPGIREMKTLKKRANEFRNMAHKYKRQFGKAEREQRKSLFDEAYKLIREASDIEQYVQDDVLAKSQVITATLVGSNHFTIKKMRFDTVVIDEAGQALEPACWIPVLKTKRIILAGDHLQLPPTVKTESATGNDGLNKTLLEKVVMIHPGSVVMLEEQYRMNKQIMNFSSAKFYDGKLQAHQSVANHSLDDQAFVFIDTAGCGFEEKTEQTSITNPDEAHFLLKRVRAFEEANREKYTGEDFPTIGIIAPYREQVNLLKELVRQDITLAGYGHRITVNTVDSFQGQERDAIFIGMTRSNSDGIIGFLSDIRRMNVAMTRARKKLVIVGDSATIGRHPFYADMISYAESINAHLSAWEFMID